MSEPTSMELMEKELKREKITKSDESDDGNEQKHLLGTLPNSALPTATKTPQVHSSAEEAGRHGLATFSVSLMKLHAITGEPMGDPGSFEEMGQLAVGIDVCINDSYPIGRWLDDMKVEIDARMPHFVRKFRLI
jgi:hypothetical protein